MTDHAVTLIAADWIITCNPEDAVLRNHCLVMDGERIAALAPEAAALQRFPQATILRLPHQALMPGLINAHTHAAMSLLRGYADDLPLMSWLQDHIWPAEKRWVDPGFVQDGTQLAIAEMLRGGITCFNDMYFFPDVTTRVAAEAGIRAVIGLIVIDFPTAWAENADEYLEKALRLHDEYRDHAQIRTALAPHAPYTVSDAPLSRLAVLADELDTRIHMHIHETSWEITSSLQQHGVRPLERLHRLGLVSSNLLAVHMTQLTPEDIALCAEHQVKVVHCPESNLKLASGFCPVAALDAAGVCVALGTDGAASNNDLDLLGEARTAAFLGKGVAGDPAALPARQILRMATLQGAQALGIDDWTGSLEVGKMADLISIDLSALGTTPCFDPVAQILYAASRHQISRVWVAGRELVRDGILLCMDEAAIKAKALRWQQRLLEARQP